MSDVSRMTNGELAKELVDATYRGRCHPYTSDILEAARRLREMDQDTQIVNLLASAEGESEVLEEGCTAVLGNGEPDHRTRGVCIAIRELLRKRDAAKAAATKGGE